MSHAPKPLRVQPGEPRTIDDVHGGRRRSAASALRERLEVLPRARFAIAPTPIQFMSRLSESLGVRLFVKRDDMTGLAFGGNKVRQMEFFFGEAQSLGADTIVAGGSYAQSNHSRVAAAAARAIGLHSVILQRPNSGWLGVDSTGNGLLTRLLAGEVRLVAALEDAPRGDRLQELEGRRKAFEEVAAELRERGRRPYVLAGSSLPLGVMGYLEATLELIKQQEDLGVAFTHVFVTSLGVTHAGLHLGAELTGADYKVVGAAYQPATDDQAAAWVRGLAEGAADLLNIDRSAEREVVSDARFGGPQYGEAGVEAARAIDLAAEMEAILLDPAYTAKGFATMLQWIAEERITRGDRVLFVHTGGLPLLFTPSFQTLLDDLRSHPGP